VAMGRLRKKFFTAIDGSPTLLSDPSKTP